MTIDSRVVVVAQPLLWGIGTIVAIDACGLLIVEFADGTAAAFHAHELELADRWQQSEAALLTSEDFDQLRKANA